MKIGGVEGTVEEIGFRCTRIRTFESSLVSVPNQELVSGIIDNMGQRSFCLLPTSDTADVPLRVNLAGGLNTQKKTKIHAILFTNHSYNFPLLILPLSFYPSL